MNALRLRRALFSLLLALLIAALISSAWFPQVERKTNHSVLPNFEEAQIETRVSEFQAKLVAGITDYLHEHPDQAGTSSLLPEFISSIFSELNSTYVDTASDRALAAGQMLLVARYIGEKEAETALQGSIIGSGEAASEAPLPSDMAIDSDLAAPTSESAPEPSAGPEPESIGTAPAAPTANATVDAASPAKFRKEFLLTLGRNTPEGSVAITPENRDWVKEKLGWFGQLYLLYYDSDQTIRQAAKKQVYDDAQYAFQKLVVASTAGTVILICAVLSFLFLIIRAFLGKLKSDLDPMQMDAGLLMETFTLYLGAMYFLPRLMEKLVPALVRNGITFKPMVFELIAIPSVGLVVLWPLLWGTSWSNLRQTIGVRLSAGFRSLADIIVAPMTFLAAWLPLAGLMVIYSLLLKYFNVDPRSGTHPIVPLLVETKDTTVLLQVMILAVVIAPLIEELLFRGVFYSWLRTRFSAGFSIIVSALLFASVHPQGAVGVLPLTYIGCVLACLREWRGSLIAPMIAHACFNGGTMALLLFLFK